MEGLSMQRRTPRIVLAASTGIRAADFAQLFDCFRQWADGRLIATRTAQPFIRQRPIPSGTQVTIEEGDLVSHVELCEWADLMVISPLCFNTLSAMARGKRDGLVTRIALVWDHRKPIFYVPSMASDSWMHPFMEQYLTTLVEDLGMNPIKPTQVVPRGGEGYMICYNGGRKHRTFHRPDIL